MIRKIRAIYTKEFFHILRDRRSLTLAFAVPLMLILLFGYVLNLDVEHIETVVLDHDNTPRSRDFIRSLGASPYFQFEGYVSRAGEIDTQLGSGKAKLAVIIPYGWTADIMAGRDTTIQAIIDGSNPNIATATRSFFLLFVEQYNAQTLNQFLERSGQPHLSASVNLDVRIWFNEDLESKRFIMPAIIAIVIIIVGALLTSLVIAREYENGTMETLRSLPLGALEIIIGKAIPYFVISLLDVIIAVFLSQFLFGIVMKGNLLLMGIATTLYLFVAVALGLLISTITKSQLVANQIALVSTFLPSFMLSDFIFPKMMMPPILQAVLSIILATYYIDVLYGVYMRGARLEHFWTSLVVLLFMMVVLVMGSYLALRKEVR